LFIGKPRKQSSKEFIADKKLIADSKTKKTKFKIAHRKFKIKFKIAHDS